MNISRSREKMGADKPSVVILGHKIDSERATGRKIQIIITLGKHHCLQDEIID